MTREEVILWAACIAALSSIVGVIVNATIAMRSKRRDALAQIAACRVKWIEDLRLRASSFLTLCYSLHEGDDSDQDSDDSIVSINRDMEVMKLMLNEQEDSALYQSFEDIILSACDEDSADFYGRAITFRHAIRGVIKAEWDRAKSEMGGAIS